MPSQRTCSNCGSTERYYAKGLCARCYDNARYRSGADHTIQRVCLICGRDFLALPEAVKRGEAKYCSNACKGIARRGLGGSPICIRCGAIRSPGSALDLCQSCYMSDYRATHKAERRANHATHRQRDNGYRLERRAKARGVHLDWDAIYERDKGLCHICRKNVTRSEMSLDHVVPIACGGGHNFENVRSSHFQCNQRRQHRGPGQPYLL